MYNFDEIVNRKNTNCLKHDKSIEIFGTEDIIPMWVADMDFKTPDFILDEIKQRLDHEVLGYTFRSESFYNTAIKWVQERNNYTVSKDWISFSPGVVPALAMIINAFTHPGDKIIVQSPVYFPFFSSVLNSGRQLINNKLRFENNSYTMDFDNLSKQIDSKTKMILLCSPHNPVGRVWSKSELEKLASICLKNNILIVSDEIHSDIILGGNKHVPIASLSPEISDITITTYAPSKTFNLAGLSTSWIVASNPKLKSVYDNYIENLHIYFGNIFGNIALEAAYTNGQNWLEEMIKYVENNFNLVREFTENHKDKITLIDAEASYLAWLNFNRMGLSHEKLNHFIIRKAKLGLNSGATFGEGGEGFQRMNLACPKAIVQKALNRLDNAFKAM